MNYSQLYQLFAYLLYTRIDAGIGYEGWTLKEVEDYLSSKGLNTSMAEDLLRTFSEGPGQYAAYGYGMLYTYEIHEKAKEELGEYFNMIDFNEEFLSHGWIPISDSRAYMNEYIENLKFVYGLTD